MEDNNYEEIKDRANLFYKNINKIFCPFFNEKIVFNSEGFNHLIYKNKSKRLDSEQIMRFKLLERAIKLIGLTNTKQDFSENIIVVKKKKHKKIINSSENVYYYGFIGIINNFRIKVIIRKIGNGNRHFWSVIPAWNTKHYQGIKIIENFENNFEIE